MSFKLISFVVAFLAAVVISVTIRLFMRDRLTVRIFLMWIFLWIIMGFFALFPGALDYLMGMVTMGNRLVFLFVSAIVIVYVVLFYISSHTTEMNRKVSKLAQEIAILNSKFEKSRRDINKKTKEGLTESKRTTKEEQTDKCN